MLPALQFKCPARAVCVGGPPGPRAALFYRMKVKYQIFSPPRSPPGCFAYSWAGHFSLGWEKLQSLSTLSGQSSGATVLENRHLITIRLLSVLIFQHLLQYISVKCAKYQPRQGLMTMIGIAEPNLQLLLEYLFICEDPAGDSE